MPKESKPSCRPRCGPTSTGRWLPRTCRDLYASAVDQFEEVDFDAGGVLVASGGEFPYVWLLVVGIECCPIGIHLVEDAQIGAAVDSMHGEHERSGLVFANSRDQFSHKGVECLFVSLCENEPHHESESVVHGILLGARSCDVSQGSWCRYPPAR